MHNRVRMIAASLLGKHLLQPCGLGRTYPHPIVDHKEARALAAFEMVK